MPVQPHKIAGSNNADHSQPERRNNQLNSFGITNEEKSVSLLDSIAIKEEDSTQKKFIEPLAGIESADHGGNEQSGDNP